MRNRENFLKVFDLIKGTKVKKYFDFYRSTLYWGRKEIEKYQLVKLKDLLSYAHNYVPFYSRKFEKLNLTPDSIKHLEDLQKFPVLTREDIQNNFNDLLSIKKIEGKYFKGGSSGTTGVPINYFHDSDGISAGIAAAYMGWHLSGWKFGEKGLHIWGNPSSIKQWKKISSRSKRFLFNQKYLASPLLNDLSNYPNIVHLLNKYHPDYIDGYTSSIFSLAQYIKKNNISVPKCKYIFSTAENLLDYQREIIEEVLGPVSDLYGCGEINGVAAQPLNSDKYFILEPHVIVEKEGEIDDESKQILITDLDNRLMPFIRYKAGDLIDDVYEGNNSNIYEFRFFKKIIGRTSEIIDLRNDKKILPVNLLGGTLFREFKEIARHKVVWNGKFLNFIFETNDNFDIQLVQKKIDDNLKNFDVSFKIELVKKILPDKSGKYKYIEIDK